MVKQLASSSHPVLMLTHVGCIVTLLITILYLLVCKFHPKSIQSSEFSIFNPDIHYPFISQVYDNSCLSCMHLPFHPRHSLKSTFALLFSVVFSVQKITLSLSPTYRSPIFNAHDLQLCNSTPFIHAAYVVICHRKRNSLFAITIIVSLELILLFCFLWLLYFYICFQQ